MNDTPTLRTIALLREIAEELPLEVILLELRDFYREIREDEFTKSCAEYRQVCDTSLRGLDAALWKLESETL
jgi:hypothetical protein